MFPPWFMLRVRDLMNLDWPVCSPQSEVLCTHLLDWPVCSPQSEVLCTHLPAHSLSSYSASEIWARALSLWFQELLRCPLFSPFSESEFWIAALKLSANASNIMDLSMVLRFGSSRSCGASPQGVLDLIWNTQVLPFVGLSAHSPRQGIWAVVWNMLNFSTMVIFSQS